MHSEDDPGRKSVGGPEAFVLSAGAFEAPVTGIPQDGG
jgi:hypothetical protein